MKIRIMRGGSMAFIFFTLLFITIVDLYSFRGVRSLTPELIPWLRVSIHLAFWLVPIIILALIVYITMHRDDIFTPARFRIWYAMMGLFVLFYVPKLVFIVFQLGNDILRISGWLVSRFSEPGSPVSETADTITRTQFLTRVGIVAAAIPFIGVFQGIVKGRYNYKVKNIDLRFPNLPGAFNGFRVLQISDWHIGSFWGQETRVQEAVDMINEQDADVILFTGDLVNNIAEEVRPFTRVLSQLRAKHGIYSILGNHDYGEYVSWESEDAHRQNMVLLEELQKESGFTLLRNDSISINRGKEVIGIAGVENWGLKPFPQYGDIAKSKEKIKDLPFKILMSHDPSHWDAQVLPDNDFDLTLSGHTHGMQFGINIPGVKWSPVKWKYPRWSGLYNERDKYLYVNVGIGYIAFPGRVGFYPEITVFTLHRQT